MKHVCTFLILLMAGLPAVASASSAALMVKAGRESVNALEATLTLPPGMGVDQLYDGNSALLIWVKRPAYDEASRTISFSGIAPGGFSGEKMILSFSGSFEAEDLSSISFSGVAAFKNDGSGGSAPVTFSVVPFEVARDELPPVPFVLTISSSPAIFEGRRFVSFAAQDKGTGIERYEYATTWLLPPGERDWKPGDSPIPLSRSMLFQNISVRALDRAGNAAEASTAGPYRYPSIGIIITACALLLLRRSLRSRSSPSY
ncbi:hypothetical protein KW784_01085 [Candidatus Parcubacteria bacterium]|nr:hypothetical protein [Candidatus Parcubacteria bacterium]